MKSLQRVQTVAKIFRVIAKIGYVCSIIGVTCCVIGAIFCGISGANETIREWIVKNGETFRPKEGVSACVCAAISCGFGIAICRYNVQYYSAVLAEGTPFTKPLVSKLRRLGVLTIVLSVAEAIVIAVFTACMKTEADYTHASGVATGIAYLLVSLLMDYGADIRDIAGKAAESGNAESSAESSAALSAALGGAKEE